MRNIIFYNPAVLVAAEGADHAEATLDDIRATAAAVRGATNGSAFLRDASHFNGNLERHNEELPNRVLLLGPDGGFFNAVRQAFEAVEVPVEDLALHEAKAPGEGQAPEKPATDALSILKARATELGLNFNPNIGEATLRARVEAKEKEIADEAAANVDAVIPIGEGTANGENA